MTDNIHFVVDSVSAVLETECLKDPHIHCERLVVNHGDEEWFDGDRSLEEMVALVEKTGKLPSTSQPPLGRLLETFTRLAKAGNKVFFVTLDSALSGTYQTGCMAAKQVMSDIKGSDVRVIDSKTAAIPIVAIVKAMQARIADGCEDMDELERYGNDLVARTKTFFSVETLDYLQKGGRIGKASALIGGFFGIRPILTLDKNGKVEIADKCRSRKKVLKRIIEIALAEGAIEEYYVCNALCPGDADAVLKQLQEALPGVPYMTSSIGTVLASHLGPGVIGVFVRRKA